MADESPDNVLERLDEHLKAHPHLQDRIYRQLLMTLHTQGVVTIESIYDEARLRAGLAPTPTLDDPNQPAGKRLGEDDRVGVEQVAREYAGRHLGIGDIDDLANLVVKREEARELGDIANLDTISFRLLADHVNRFCKIPLGATRLDPSEVLGIRVELTRRLINDQLEYIGVAKNFLHVRDFEHLMGRIVGSDSGMGRIGGKSGGMLLGHRILEHSAESDDERCLIPESYYLRSDVINDFLELNRLSSYRNQKYKSADDIRAEYPLIKGVFRNADFPVEIVQSLRGILDEVGTHPLIVRSSSLLEDRFGTAFYGKYASVFVTNQGDLEQRLQILLGAIAEVFASIMAPDPILYRREHNLIDYDEDMAVLIQKVVGQRVGRYFVPAFAGVASSRNEYPFSARIRREDGLCRLVMGLGTRAVDRVGSDYPRMVPLGQPTLRPESNVGEIKSHAQRGIDVLDLQSRSLRTVTLADLLRQHDDFPLLDGIVSICRDGELYRPTGTMVREPADQLCITFDKLLAESDLAERLRKMLKRLEAAYGVPVEIEFAHDGTDFYLLQCRCQTYPASASETIDSEKLVIPTNIAPDRVVFTAHRYVRSALIEGLEYVIYVDPLKYHEVSSSARRVAIGRVVGRLNRRLADCEFALVGPGRWGSKDILLGVPVSYADINHTRLLIEVARARGGYVPEVSFGTHFFQDLVEAGIHYLPLYPDESANCFSEAFFSGSANSLATLLPDDADFAEEIRVIHIPEVGDQQHLRVIMNGEVGQAIAYLD